MAILNFLSQIMADILKYFQPNYGWGIIILTFLVRLILFPTSISQVRSMETMKVITPKQKELQEKYRDKPEEMNRRLLELYREHKYNPLGGCLPLILQMPFFFAIIGLLQNPAKFGIDLTNVHFFGVLLTAKGSMANIAGSLGNLVLAVLSGGTTYIQQKIMSPQTQGTDTAGSMQSAFLYVMPIFFGFITFTMAAAFGIYWAAQNVFGILQQLVIVRYFTHRPAPAGEEPAKRRSQHKGR